MSVVEVHQLRPCLRLISLLCACRSRSSTTLAKLPSAAALKRLFIRAVPDGAASRQNTFDFAVGTRNYVNADQFTDPARCCSTRIGRGLHGTDIAPHKDRHISGTDVFFADKLNICGL